MHAGSWQSLHLGPGVSVIVPARPRAGRGGRRASSVVCAGERQVRAWNRPGGGSGGPRRERVGVCDRYGRTVVPTARRLYRDCFRSTSTVDTYSRTYRGTYSLTTHEYRHYTSQTDTNLDRGAHVATPAPLERAAFCAIRAGAGHVPDRYIPSRTSHLAPESALAQASDLAGCCESHCDNHDASHTRGALRSSIVALATLSNQRFACLRSLGMALKPLAYESPRLKHAH